MHSYERAEVPDVLCVSASQIFALSWMFVKDWEIVVIL